MEREISTATGLTGGHSVPWHAFIGLRSLYVTLLFKHDAMFTKAQYSH